jgi:phosphoenolpyruvate synthase/pyruvate phosphate dikinase
MNDDIMAVAAHLTGGKGSSLALLNTIEGVKVPDFFVVTTAGFKAHFKGSEKANAALVDL